MARIYKRLLLSVAWCGLLVLLTGSVRAQGQSVFRVSIGRLTASAGDTVVVNVGYTFTSTKAHTIHGYAAQFSFDSTLIRVLDFSIDSTATAGFSGVMLNRTPPNVGLVALGDQEIDLTNPILFKIKIAVNKQLSDTGFLLWNRAITVVDQSWGVDSVIEDDGWVRTPESKGHVVLTTPGVDVHGSSNGFTPDSVRFDLPVLLSDVSASKIQDGVLRFVFDPTRLLFQSARQTNGHTLEGTTQNGDTVLVHLLIGTLTPATPDTLTILQFVGLVGTDTSCGAFQDVRLTPLNGDAFFGNTIYVFDSICLFGSWQNLGVSRSGESNVDFEIFPNPVRVGHAVSFRSMGFDDRDRIRISVINVLGNVIHQTDDGKTGWEIAPTVSTGVYEVIFEDFTRNVRSVRKVVVGP